MERVVRKGRVVGPLHSGFDADLVVESEPELLLAADVMFRCLDGHGTEKKLNLVQFAAGEMAKTRTCPSQVVRCQLSIPAASAALLTISQSTLGVMPWPQIVPDLLIALKRRPSLIPLASVQRSTASFAQRGIGTVRICPAFPWRSTMTQ